MREPRSLGSLPTVRPSDIQWLDATRPLLTLPAGTVAVDSPTLPSPAELERWVGFFAAAVAFDAAWGVLHGAVRVTTVELEGHRVDVICAFGRLAILVVEGERFASPPRPKEIASRIARAVTSGEHYSLEWAAAAYALQVLEAE